MKPAPDFWIMRPFNPLFWSVFAAFLALLALASAILRRRSDRTRRIALSCACLVTLIGFFFYKYYLSIDADYDVITAGMGGFNWWGELPLQLCNINMILIPIAVLTDKRPLMCFCFFVGALGAMMALAMPVNGFDGYSLLLPRMLGFYGTHFMIVIEAFAIVTLGLYRPRFRDIPMTLVTILLIAFVIFGIDMLLRWSGLHPKANYFFAVETEGNALLELFYKLLPYPFLYLLPCSLVLAVYMSVIIAGFALADQLKKSRKNEPLPRRGDI